MVSLFFIGVFCLFSIFSFSGNLVSYKIEYLQKPDLERSKVSVSKESKYVHTSEKDILRHISHTEENLHFQNSNLKMYRVLGVLIIVSLIIFTIISLKKTKEQYFVEEENLKAKWVKMRTQNQLLAQHLMISKSFHKSFNQRFEHIWISLKNIKNTFEIKDKHLEDEINGINAFTENTLLEFRQLLHIINKLQ
jgi:hypothetical protein